MSFARLADDEEGEEEGPVSGNEGGGGGGSGKRPLSLCVCMRGAKWSTEGPYCSTPFPPLYLSLVFTAHSSP